MSGLRFPRHQLPDGVVRTKAPAKREEDLVLDDLCPHGYKCQDPETKKHACQRQALIIASAHGAVAGEDGVVKASIEALKRKTFIHERTSKKGRTSWRATDRGRFIVADDRPVFLHKTAHLGMGSDGSRRSSGYTFDPSSALVGEDGRPCEVLRDAA